MTHKKTDEGYPIFRSYLEEENDKPYYSMNTLSFYYEDMERKQKLIEDLAKAIVRYDQTLTGNLAAIEQQVTERFEQWDEKLKAFDGSVMDLLQEWVDDGTMDHIVDSSIVDRKLEPITTQLSEKATKEELETERQRLNNFTTLQEGSTTGDAELIDLRVGSDGKIYDNAGEHARAIGSDLKKYVLYEDYPDLKNLVLNSTFDSGDNWNVVSGGVNFVNGKAVISSTETTLLETIIERKAGHIYHLRARIKKPLGVSFLFLSNGGTISGSAVDLPEFSYISARFTAPSSVSSWKVGLRFSATTSTEVDNVSVIDLTEHFGAGNEPTDAEMNKILDDLLGGFVQTTASGYYTIKKRIESHETAIKTLTESQQEIPVQDVGIAIEKDYSPVLFGVKMTNARDITTGNADSPRPVGWLYYHPVSFDLYYANGSPENMKKLCKWDKTVTRNGTGTPINYRPFITREGDIILVWRGDVNSNFPRENPIVYPAGDYSNPVVVDFGTGLKPTAWLQNSGADFIYNEDVFLFSEYTRPHHDNAYIWKVTKPFTNPANWVTKKTFPLTGDLSTGMEHMHTMSYDTFSGVLYATTGDNDAGSKIYISEDLGETWTVDLEGSRIYTRLLYFSFTKEGVYWASDDTAHYFFYAPRVGNKIDFSQREELANLIGHPPTYVNILIEDPYGILILNRHDTYNNNEMDILFWDIKSATMHTLATVGSTHEPIASGVNEGKYLPYGFRLEAINWYHVKGDTRIVAGFGNPTNCIDVAGNTAATTTHADKVNNIVMKVVEKADGYGIEFSTIADRT